MGAAPAAAPSRRPGWCATPHGYFLEWRRYFPGIEHDLIGIILDRTNGADEEWTAISKRKFMLWTGNSKSTIKRGLAGLKKKAVIQVQRAIGGRGITPLYRVDRDAIEHYILEQKGAHGGLERGFTSGPVSGRKRGSPVRPRIKDPILNQTPPPPFPSSSEIAEEEELKTESNHSGNIAGAVRETCQTKRTGQASSSDSEGFDEFITAYPPARADYTKARKAYNVKASGAQGEHELLMRSLAEHKACQRWKSQPQFIPLASSFISQGHYNGPPPPYFEVFSGPAGGPSDDYPELRP